MSYHFVMQALFITGTDTNVGKTYVASAIVRRLRESGVRVGAYKPAASGAVVTPGNTAWEDVEELYQALGGRFARELICPQRFLAAVAPPVSARLEGRTVDARLLRDGARAWSTLVDMLVIEGAGGWLSPLGEDELVADVARDLGVPVVVVARRGLGMINHTLLTVESILARGLTVAGIVLNSASAEGDDPSIATNQAELERRLQRMENVPPRAGGRAPHDRRDAAHVPNLGVVEFGRDLLRDQFFRRIDWLALTARLSTDAPVGG